MAFITTPRLTFHYRIHGQADGLPMLLVHGSFASSRWWEPLMALLPEEIYAVAPDLRGCGASDKPETGYTIEEMAEDLWAFVQGLELRGFDLAAHASGAAVALEFTLNHLDRVNSLTLIDPAPVEGIFTPIETIMVLERMRGDEQLLALALASLMPTYPFQEPAHAAFFEQLVRDAQAMAPAAYTAIAESLGRWNRFQSAKQLTLPTLILWGDQDQLVPREAMTRTLIAIPGANNLEVLKGVGHSPMLEAPLTLAERLLEFITQDFTEFEAVRAEAMEQKD